MRGSLSVVIALTVLFVAVMAGQAAELEFAHDKGNWQEFFEEIMAIAEEELDITINVVPFPNTSAYQAAMRTSLRTPSAPNVFTWWSKYRMEDIVSAGVVLEVGDVWDAHGDAYAESMRDSMSFDGKVYGVPLYTSYWTMFYNTDVFEEHGLTEPQTWEELMEIAEYLKSQGITPFGMSLTSEWQAIIWFQQLLIGTDPDFYHRLMEGEARYTDPEATRVFNLWRDMIEKGYFTDFGLAADPDIVRLFGQGQVAMLLWGDWFAAIIESSGGDVNYSQFLTPPVDPEAGDAVIVEVAPLLASSRARDQEAAKEFLKWWMSVEAQTRWMELGGWISANQYVPANALPPVKQKLARDLSKGNYRYLTRMWEATPPDIVENAVGHLSKFMLNPDTQEEVQRDLDELARSYWANRQL